MGSGKPPPAASRKAARSPGAPGRSASLRVVLHRPGLCLEKRAAPLTAAIVLLSGQRKSASFIAPLLYTISRLNLECNLAPAYLSGFTVHNGTKESAMNGVHCAVCIRAYFDLDVSFYGSDLPRRASEARRPVDQDQVRARCARAALDLPRPSEGRRVSPRDAGDGARQVHASALPD